MIVTLSRPLKKENMVTRPSERLLRSRDVSSGLGDDRLQVCHRPPGLRSDPALDEIARGGVEAELSGDEEEFAVIWDDNNALLSQFF